jgi:hypothetical protein
MAAPPRTPRPLRALHAAVLGAVQRKDRAAAREPPEAQRAHAVVTATGGTPERGARREL